ncbi:hypothetical protein X805_09720 [Sphaerotilus natans subsp. natans DSM 6575]|uniref:Carrier domain-containing protein n=1 Tax=Sphaerotilus natans subsp. natans DSM 6575 TaxID=1286631 RepID=A0A059KPG9_9BURK|nr:non-ribosomal peptide synthetase [Sphaerotilus natans]KDB53387.1 hypothetical protein X805_09720 [Sphaerotilus natans subsp. natans DSM 6575]SIR25403.1 non-ribosomal peptide synthase domain TIGR01720/amino acid adenylation domain-containing protein [Sphaerotilus natans]
MSTSDVLDLVADLAARDIRLSLEGEALRVNGPAGRLPPELIARLRAHKPGLIEFLRRHAAPAATGLAIVAPPRPPRLPLSWSQQRLWFLDQLDGPGATYNIALALRLHGPLDVDALEAAWREIERRHEVLRTCFPDDGSGPHQHILPPSLALQHTDLSGLPEHKREAALQALADAEAAQVFDLARGPLWCVRLVRLDTEAHALFVTMHHAISDGWSIGVLTHELTTLYAGATLPPLPLQYADVALWQRDAAQEAALTRQIAYWRRQLDGVPAHPLLLTDHPRPAQPSHRGERRLAPLPPALATELRRLAQAQGVTLFMLLQAAFAVLLMRHTRQEDLCIGTPVANRPQTELEPLVGFFVNTLVLRHDLSDDPDTPTLLARVRRTTLDAFEHQAVPFERIVEALQPERQLAFSPLFQVLFVLQNTPRETLKLGPARFSPLESTRHAAKFELTLTVWEDEQALTPAWNWASDLFEPATIERMAGHYQRLLEGMVATPHLPVGQLPLLGESERRTLLHDWNDTATVFAAAADGSTLHQRLHAQTRRTPQAIAARDTQGTLSYQALEERSDRLAAVLRAAGVGPEVAVGLCVERTTDLPVGLLAILKAGGAWLPLDPAHPPARLLQMREEARLQVLLTHSRLREACPPGAERIIEIDRLDGLPTAPPGLPAGPDHLAYVLYTSGSTGRPKGVEVTHRSLLNYLDWCVRTYPVAAGRGVPVNASFGFDGTLPALLAPLLVGAEVLLLSEDRQFEELVALLRPQAAPQGAPLSFIKGTPTHLELLHRLLGTPEAAGNTRGLSTTALVLGGEALPRALLEAWWRHAPGTRVFNQYGPTEATVACCWHEARPDEGGGGHVPIGRPVANTQIHLLDRHGELVPIGAPGELHIGGVQVARGYRQQPALSAERFVANPFGAGRLYRSGDLARWRADGRLEYLGRLDGQVKVNGVRIEPGEIEAQLLHCGGGAVSAAAVVVRETPQGGHQLVAYVVGQAGEEVEGSTLRAALARVLPAYMVPACIVGLPALPMTPNGKLDRRALPEPPAEAGNTGAVAPRTPVEALLMRIWCEVLRHERLGVTDNFFQVGGDSILSIQIVSRARAAGLHLKPRDLFQHQTIAELAAIAQPEAQAGGAVVGERLPASGPLPLTPIQRRFFAQEWAEPQHFNQAMLLELDPQTDPDTLEAALRVLVDHHEALRTRFVRAADGHWQADIAAIDPARPGAGLVLERADFSALAEADWTEALRERASACQQGMDLAAGRLVRALWIERGARRLLLLAIHHLVVDGVSWRLLLDDLPTACDAVGRRAVPVLPARTLSFADWARQLQQDGPAAVADERAYWAGIAAGGVPALPIDHMSGPDDQASAESVTTRLDPADTAALLHQAPAAWQTRINDLLLAALLRAWRRWSGQRELLLSLEGHGREDVFDGRHDVDVSRTVGWFTAIFPVRLALPDGDEGPGATIRSVKETLRRVPRHGVGHGILTQLGGAQALAVSPGLCFNYLGQFDQQVAADGLIRALAPEEVGPTRSPSAPRAHALELTCLVAGGRLEIVWGYSRHRHLAASIERLAAGFTAALRELIDHCVQPGAGGRTPSDFPEAGLDQAGLDKALHAIHRANPQAGPVHRAIESIHPLSPSQQGMLMETLAHAGSGIHVEQSVMSWQGDFDRHAFGQAWQALLARHASLRSGFLWEGLDEPLQFVLRPQHAVLPITEVDLRGQNEPDPRRRVMEQAEAERRRGFAPDAVPLMRVALLQADADLHHLVWTRHHLLSDGWSVSVMMQDFMALYLAASRGEPAALPPTRPYADYIRWLRAQDPAASETFWRGHLAGLHQPPRLRHGTAPAADAPRGHASQEHVLPAGLGTRLAAFGRQHGLTSGTLMQSAWALTLHQLGGARDLVFGATVSGRPPELAGVEQMVGMFISSVPVRVCLDDAHDVTRLAWLRTMQDRLLEAQPHGHCAAGQIQSWSEVPAGQPLYDSLLVFENYPVAQDDGSGPAGPLPRIGPFVLDGDEAIGARTRHALTLLVLPGEPMRLRFIRDRRRLDEAAVNDIASRLIAVLDALIGEPSQPLHTLLVPEERIEDGAEGEKEDTLFPLPRTDGEPPVPPRNDTERQLLELWRHLLGTRAIGVRDSFFDLGGHSLAALRLMARIRQQFRRDLPLAALLQHPTIETVARLLADPENDSTHAEPTLVPLSSRGPGLPLHCVPGAGGYPLYLHALARELGDDRPVFGLQATGLDGRTPPHATVEAAAAHHLGAIRQVQPRGPYLLGGHSFGGKVAFEMARQLRQAGEAVAGVVLLDVTAPGDAHTDPPVPDWDDARWLVALATAFGTMAGQRCTLGVQTLRALDAAAQMQAFQRELERMELLPPQSDPRQARGWVEVFRSQLLMRYQPAGQADFPLLLLKAADPMPREPDQGEALPQQHDAFLGWQRWSDRPVERIEVPGTHLTMMSRPHVEVLAEHLRAALHRLETSATARVADGVLP